MAGIRLSNFFRNNRLIFRLTVFAAGLLALIWFLIRVIPKPSRATYPCQRAAFPLASAFVIWLTGVVSSYFGLKLVGKFLAKHGTGIEFIYISLKGNK